MGCSCPIMGPVLKAPGHCSMSLGLQVTLDFCAPKMEPRDLLALKKVESGWGVC